MHSPKPHRSTVQGSPSSQSAASSHSGGAGGGDVPSTEEPHPSKRTKAAVRYRMAIIRGVPVNDARLTAARVRLAFLGQQTSP
jgi:hypothetical protein